MVKLARKVIAANECNTIKVVCKRSDELSTAASGDMLAEFNLSHGRHRARLTCKPSQLLAEVQTAPLCHST